MISTFDEVSARQAEWSATADHLKRSFQLARWINFALMIAAALLAAIASQRDGTPRFFLTSVSAAMFGIVTLLTARLVTAANAREWVRARAAAEVFKRLAYTYAAAAAPYNDVTTRDRALMQDAQQVQDQVADLLGKRVGTTSKGRISPALAPADYVDRRVVAAVSWYEKRANEHGAVVRRLRQCEFALALVTTVLTAVAGVLQKDVARGAGKFDFVALTAVLTTISGAILAHVEASRYDFLIVTFRATALQLRAALADQPGQLDPASPAWSDFVRRCEDLIAGENGSWVLKMSKG